jgi:hypothetical protein
VLPVDIVDAALLPIGAGLQLPEKENGPAQGWLSGASSVVMETSGQWTQTVSVLCPPDIHLYRY